MEDNEKTGYGSADVSEPRETRREQDVINEALAIRRREWIRNHMSVIFAAIGVVVVGVIVFIVLTAYQSNNPVRYFSSALYKDFGQPFAYTVSVTEDGEEAMRYEGTIEIDRLRHTVQARYEADHGAYTYTGAVYSEANTAFRGSLYQDKWTTHDCTDMVQNFFDFDTDFRYGGFDCGAFMRFTGLTTDYSIYETAKFVKVIKSRLSADSELAVITTEKTGQETRYHYEFSLDSLMRMVKEDGASVFYRSTDYDRFCKTYENNKSIIEQSKCSVDFVIDAGGYMTSFDANIATQGKSYSLSCTMSDFGTAQVVLPDDFVETVKTPAPTE